MKCLIDGNCIIIEKASPYTREALFFGRFEFFKRLFSEIIVLFKNESAGAVTFAVTRKLHILDMPAF